MSKERRSRIRITKQFQKQFLKLIVSGMLAVLIVALAAVYIALRVQITGAGFAAYTQERLFEVISWLNWFLPLVALVFASIAVYAGTRISLEVAGPLYALERQLYQVNEGIIDKVQLRSEDNELIPLAEQINLLLEKGFGT